MRLKEQLDEVMPGWERWYPSVFDAAEDLGLIRARVCSPSSLLLSNRHARIQGEALQSFRERWTIDFDPEVDQQDEDETSAQGQGPGRSRNPKR